MYVWITYVIGWVNPDTWVVWDVVSHERDADERVLYLKASKLKYHDVTIPYENNRIAQTCRVCGDDWQDGQIAMNKVRSVGTKK